MESREVGFREELERVREQLCLEIKFRAAEFDQLVSLQQDELDRYACPAIVLAVSRACGYAGDRAVGLAAIMQYIYMADRVHRLMQDEGLSEAERQFPVLVGDFLYGKYFLGLCREQLLDYLAPLAQGIATMCQGAIKRWLLLEDEADAEDWLDVLVREQAVLTGLAARLGADLAGASLQVQERLEDLGSELGLAWAAAKQRLGYNIVGMALRQARKILGELPDDLQLRPLEELYAWMAGYCCPELKLS